MEPELKQSAEQGVEREGEQVAPKSKLKTKIKSRLFWNKTRTWQLLVCVVVGFSIGGVVYLWREFPSNRNYFRVELANSVEKTPGELRDLIQDGLGEKYEVCHVSDGAFTIMGYSGQSAMREVFLRRRLGVVDYWQIKWRLRGLAELRLVLPPVAEMDFGDDYCDRVLAREAERVMDGSEEEMVGVEEEWWGENEEEDGEAEGERSELLVE